MHIRAPADQEEGPLNLTSMMDMVFNLLIFFLVATTIVEEERELTVKLPQTVQADAQTLPPRQVVINIRADGSVVVAGEVYDVNGLSAKLRELARQDPMPTVLIRSDKHSEFRHFADVVDRCREAGIAEAKIGYLKQGQ